jgi:adenylate cyclase
MARSAAAGNRAATGGGRVCVAPRARLRHTKAMTIRDRVMRAFRRRRDDGAPVLYRPGGATLRVRPGETLLAAIKRAGLRHGSVCGGEARCATCRVRIEHGLERLPSPVDRERLTLDRIRAPDDVRLACQIRPAAALTVTALHPAAKDGG